MPLLLKKSNNAAKRALGKPPARRVLGKLRSWFPNFYVERSVASLSSSPSPARRVLGKLRSWFPSPALLCLLSIISLGGSPTLASPSKSSHKFTDYQQVHTYFSELIAQAQKTVWLASSTLADGNWTTCLALAKYRGLDIAVLTSSQTLNDFRSQLPWVKAQSIPYAAASTHFFAKWPTWLAIDQKLFVLSIPLASVAKEQAIHMREVSNPGDVQKFYASFKHHLLASSPNLSALPAAPMTLQAYDGEKASSSQPWQGFEPFRYSQEPDKRPEGVANKLPKTLKWEETTRPQNP